MAEAGKVSGVFGAIVEVTLRPDVQAGPHHIVRVRDIRGRQITLELAERRPDNVCRCIALSSTFGLQRNAVVEITGEVLSVPPASSLFGRVVNVLGEPIDGKGALPAAEKIPVHGARRKRSIQDMTVRLRNNYELMETGIKIIDLLFPFIRGSKTGILGGAALGKTMLILEIIHNVIHRHQGVCIFSGVGERIREGNELYHEFVERDLLKNSILLFGQMNESAGVRFESAHSGVALAEMLRDEGKNVLFFIDNIFRFAQAGSELSALLGRIPSETGYQPTLTSEIGELHERIDSFGSGSITSVEAIYVPSDDLTDPAVVTIFSHLNSILSLSRSHAQKGVYPAVHPLESFSGHLSAKIIGDAHYAISQEVLRYFQRYEELQRIVSLIGKGELSAEEKILYERAAKLRNFLTQPFFTVEHYTGRSGVFVSLEETLAGCQEILSGRLDDLGEERFYMRGALVDIRR
ncbi:MAG: F0F1 ATP synthase subunit beta [Candidatus Omnitrophica bacterium]|nr:F0F1 ATP synthase subunit beta [Candidatus Omnitrophota bacterium]